MATLVLLRHGQSQWNLENRFTGWSDVPLTEQGEKDAGKTGEALKGLSFDLAFSSRLIRANRTLDTVLKSMGHKAIPTEYDSALNERHYGDLQGLNKAETTEKFGKEKVQEWRRSFSGRPPNGESIEDCVRRTTPYFLQYVMPHIKAGKNVIIAAHGNSLRPIMRFLENLDDDTTGSLEIGLCTPYIYTFDGDKMTNKEIREVPGIITQGASLTEKKVETGRI